MQRISQTQLLFVDVVVTNKPEGELAELCRRCKVSRTKNPYAVITDQWTNPLFLNASTQRHDHLFKQIERAKLVNQKRLKELGEVVDRVKSHCLKRRYREAADLIHETREKGYVGMPPMAELEKLRGQIDVYHAKLLKQILEKAASAELKKESLKKLRAKTSRYLPVYEKILAACRQAENGEVSG